MKIVNENKSTANMRNLHKKKKNYLSLPVACPISAISSANPFFLAPVTLLKLLSEPVQHH